METTLPVVDLDVFRLNDGNHPKVIAECKKVADALIKFGALLVKDSRVSEMQNTDFLDLMENYFAQPSEVLKKDERPEVGFQVGVTLENTEKPKCAADMTCLDIISKLAPEERPLDISGHHSDPKCRFFWKINREQPPYPTAFPALNMPNVVPDTFQDVWSQTLEAWGNALKRTVEGVASMLAIGLELPADTFTSAGKYGPHLLAPTASDLNRFGALNTILAGFHTDLNFLTIHGQSRFPGLNIWPRNTGKRLAVKFPPASQGQFLLVQAGKQLEYITGGAICAGFHEVVVNKDTLDTLEKRKIACPGRPAIRISSTFFWHLSSDYLLQPLPKLVPLAHQIIPEQDQQVNGISPHYPPIKVGDQVSMELRHIALMA